MADIETRDLICKIVDHDLPITPRIIKLLPIDNLNHIDQLWIKSSDGLFGPSVQSKIWVEIGGPLGIFSFQENSKEERITIGRYERIFHEHVGWSQRPDPERWAKERRWMDGWMVQLMS